MGRRSPVRATPSSMVVGAITAISDDASVIDGVARTPAVAERVAPLGDTLCPSDPVPASVLPAGGDPFASLLHAVTTPPPANVLSSRVAPATEPRYMGCL